MEINHPALVDLAGVNVKWVTPLSHSSRTLYATQGQGQWANSRPLYRRAGTIYFLGCHLKVTACR
jgi:hypothetical protein